MEHRIFLRNDGISCHPECCCRNPPEFSIWIGWIPAPEVYQCNCHRDECMRNSHSDSYDHINSCSLHIPNESSCLFRDRPDFPLYTLWSALFTQADGEYHVPFSTMMTNNYSTMMTRHSTTTTKRSMRKNFIRNYQKRSIQIRRNHLEIKWRITFKSSKSVGSNVTIRLWYSL